MFGDADSVQADRLRLLNHGERIKIAIGASTRRMGMKINIHHGGFSSF
jgi:hypothetical protein